MLQEKVTSGFRNNACVAFEVRGDSGRVIGEVRGLVACRGLLLFFVKGCANVGHFRVRGMQVSPNVAIGKCTESFVHLSVCQSGGKTLCQGKPAFSGKHQAVPGNTNAGSSCLPTCAKSCL